MHETHDVHLLLSAMLFKREGGGSNVDMVQTSRSHDPHVPLHAYAMPQGLLSNSVSGEALHLTSKLSQATHVRWLGAGNVEHQLAPEILAAQHNNKALSCSLLQHQAGDAAAEGSAVYVCFVEGLLHSQQH